MAWPRTAHPAPHTVLLALCCAVSLQAQTAAERRTIDSLRANFTAVTDSNYLISYERQRINFAREHRDDPIVHMELGFVAYRLGELTGQPRRYKDAASEFQWAADLRPTWALAWYHLGLSELLSGEASLIIVENIRQLMGQDALSLAVRSFARAVEVDPTFSAALVDLANAAMRQRIAPRLVVALAALRQAAGTAAGRVPEVQLVRGRIERRLLAFDSALGAFRAYLRAGGDSAIGGVELARTFANVGRMDSAIAVYFVAVGRPVGDSARREIRRDLRWFAGPGELAAYDAAPPDSVGPWLRRFWFGRDIAEGRHMGERLAEQFRRYQFVLQHFSLVSRRRGFDVAFAHSDTSQNDFDDRGIIYLRHGAPTERSQFQGAGFEPNESWLYRGAPPAPDLIVHFMALNDVQDFRLVQSLLDVCTRRVSRDPLLTSQATQVGVWRDCVQSRAQLSPEYERLARLTDNASPNVWATERQASISAVREATSTDSYRISFASTLRPVVSFFTVADEQLRPELHLVFAVPGHRLHARAGDGGASTYPLSLRMLVYDSASRRLVSALDTVRVFRARGALPEGSYLTEQLVMRVPPGRYRYTFVIEEPEQSSGDAVNGREIEIPRLDGGFSVSDVVMGRQGSGLVWRRPEGEVPLNPLMRFPRDGEASLFYEVYGLPSQAQIGTRVRILRAGGRSVIQRIFGRGGGTELAYTTTTDAPGRSRVRQTLGLRGLQPGRYVLEVELNDPLSGQTLRRATPFEIDGRSP